VGNPSSRDDSPIAGQVSLAELLRVKTFCSAATLPLKHCPSLCHLDRSVAQWRDLRFSGPFLEMYSAAFPRPAASIKPHQVSPAFARLEIANNLHRAFLVVALWPNPDPMASGAGELDHVRRTILARELVA
jgi:hypothetical protein